MKALVCSLMLLVLVLVVIGPASAAPAQDVCRLDKIGTFAEVAGAGPHRIEIGGGGIQHADFYPGPGIKAVSYIVPPAEIPDIWSGYGSIWEGQSPDCDNFDWVEDATNYAKARLDSGHSGLVVDLRSGSPTVVANVANLCQRQIDELLAEHRQAQTGAAVASCSEDVRTDHTPVVGQSWQPGPADSYRIVNFWTNEAGKDQKERKLLLQPGDNPELYGGGSAWSWPSNCEPVVQAEYNKNPHPAVTLAELRAEGLVK